MGHQSYHYLKLKGSTYYYSRRVPKCLLSLSKTSRVEVCLFTSVRISAARQAISLNQELEDHWSILRRRQRNDRIAGLFGGVLSIEPKRPGDTASGQLMSDALETYLRLKGAGRSDTFEAGARRSVGYLLEVTSDKPIDTLVRQDANALREYLKSRGLAQVSISRNFTNIRAIVNFALREHGLPTSTAFSGVYLGETVAPKKRYVPTTEELRTLIRLCRRQDDDLRWILALIADTGLRLSEAIGLHKTDVVLESDNPHILIRPHPWRRLKTPSSERVVPLIESALWSTQRAMQTTTNDFLFPRYARDHRTLSNAASAALNKWLKSQVNEEMVIHSLRHSMRDRLRDVECPAEIIDTIGGWAREGVGETYGRGYSLEILSKWLERASIHHP